MAKTNRNHKEMQKRINVLLFTFKYRKQLIFGFNINNKTVNSILIINYIRLFNFVMRSSYCKGLKKSFFTIYVTFDMYFIERIRTLLLLSSF